MGVILNDNYPALAGAYGSFLAALGGVSVTVLALVIGLRRQRSKSTIDPLLFELLVTALITTTIACFVGAHLMAETSSVQATLEQERVNQLRKHGITFVSGVLGAVGSDPQLQYDTSSSTQSPVAGNIPGALRLLMIASPCLYLSACLFLVSLVLLPTSHDPTRFKDPATIVGVIALLFIEVGASIWVWKLVYSLGQQSMMHAYYMVVTAVVIALVLYLVPWNQIRWFGESIKRACRGKTAFWMIIARYTPFISSILLVIWCMILYAFTYDERHDPEMGDVLIYCLSLVPSGALIGLTARSLFFRQVRVRYRRRVHH